MAAPAEAPAVIPPRRALRRGPLILALAGAALVGMPYVKAAYGSWQAKGLAASLDGSLVSYRNALASAYRGLYEAPSATGEEARTAFVKPEPREEALVSFEEGARPATAAVPSRFTAARLRIPAIRLDQSVREGVSRRDLRYGPGHYPGSALPGQDGNVVIAGHRTGWTQPFNDLDRLRAGDLIEVETRAATYRYRVDRVVIVSPRDVRPLQATRYPKLTLVTCHPRHTSRLRLIVEARLVT